MSKGTVVILVILGCLLLAVANVALWASLDVFNPGRFGDRVAEGLQSDAASEALARAIVFRVMEGQPELPALVQLPAQELVTWLLQRPALTWVFKETAAVASAVMTTSAQDVVGIDINKVLSNVGNQLVSVASSIDPEAGANAQAAVDAAMESADQSQRLAIYESGRLPKLRSIANTVPWLWPLAGLAAIALFLWAYLKAKAQKSAMSTIGIGVLVTGVVSLVLVPAVRAPVQNAVMDPIMQTVVAEVLRAVTRGLAIQSLILAFIGIVLIVASHSVHKEDGQAPAAAAAPAQAPAAPDQPPATPVQAAAAPAQAAAAPAQTPAAPDQPPAAPDQPPAAPAQTPAAPDQPPATPAQPPAAPDQPSA